MEIIKLPTEIKKLESQIEEIKNKSNIFTSKKTIINYFNKNNKVKIEHRVFDMIFFNLERGSFFKLDDSEVKNTVYNFILKTPKSYNIGNKNIFFLYFYFRRKNFVYEDFENIFKNKKVLLKDILDIGVDILERKIEWLSEVKPKEFIFLDELIDYLVQNKKYSILLKNKFLILNIKLENYSEEKQREIKKMCKMNKNIFIHCIKNLFNKILNRMED